MAKVKVPLAWKREVVEKHINDFPIATAMDIVDRLRLEFHMNGGFDVQRESQIRKLHKAIDDLVTEINERDE